jgi:hypothetical protein
MNSTSKTTGMSRLKSSFLLASSTLETQIVRDKKLWKTWRSITHRELKL